MAEDIKGNYTAKEIIDTTNKLSPEKALLLYRYKKYESDNNFFSVSAAVIAIGCFVTAWFAIYCIIDYCVEIKPESQGILVFVIGIVVCFILGIIVGLIVKRKHSLLGKEQSKFLRSVKFRF